MFIISIYILNKNVSEVKTSKMVTFINYENVHRSFTIPDTESYFSGHVAEVMPSKDKMVFADRTLD